MFNDGRRLPLLIDFYAWLDEYVQRSDFHIKGTTIVNILEMAKMTAKVRTPRMFQHSVEAIQIQTGEEGDRVVFRVSYPPEFWNDIYKREQLAPEKAALHRLERGMRVSIRNNAAAYEASMEAIKNREQS